MNEEKERILRMVREGKISKEEGDELLSALEESIEGEDKVSREEKPAEQPAPVTELKSPVVQDIPPPRSVGVMIAGCLLILLSLAWLFGEPWGFVLQSPVNLIKVRAAHFTPWNLFGGAILYNTLFTAFALLILIPAIGVLFFKEWARKLLIVVLAVHTIYTVLGLTIARVSFIGFKPSHFAFWTPLSHSSILLWLILDIFLIWYFSRPKIRPQFS